MLRSALFCHRHTCGSRRGGAHPTLFWHQGALVAVNPAITLQVCVVMKDRASGKSRGFGFVTFWSAGDAQRVLECSHVVDGRRCEARARGGVMHASQLLCLTCLLAGGLG